MWCKRPRIWYKPVLRVNTGKNGRHTKIFTTAFTSADCPRNKYLCQAIAEESETSAGDCLRPVGSEGTLPHLHERFLISHIVVLRMGPITLPGRQKSPKIDNSISPYSSMTWQCPTYCSVRTVTTILLPDRATRPGKQQHYRFTCLVNVGHTAEFRYEPGGQVFTQADSAKDWRSNNKMTTLAGLALDECKGSINDIFSGVWTLLQIQRQP